MLETSFLRGMKFFEDFPKNSASLRRPQLWLPRDIFAEGVGALAVDILGMKKARRVWEEGDESISCR